jgi:transposase
LFVRAKLDEETGQTKRQDASSYIRNLSKIVTDLNSRQIIFQQDGARSHTAGKVSRYLAGKKVARLPWWPSYAPDLSMIEPLWGELDSRIALLNPKTPDQLKAAALKAWREMPQSLIDRYVRGWSGKMKKYIKMHAKQ